MTPQELAREMHALWQQAHTILLDSMQLRKRIPRDDPFRRLVLEIALQDLQSFANRADALATLAESWPSKRKGRQGNR